MQHRNPGLPQDESYKAYQDAIKDGKDKAIKKYMPAITAVENDKISLVRRLNAVLAELEKVRSEKSILTSRLNDQLKSADDLNERIKKSEELTTVISKNLQDDLKYERSLNGKLREEIRSSEDQKTINNKQQNSLEDAMADTRAYSKHLTQQIEEKEKELIYLEKEKTKLTRLLQESIENKNRLLEELSNEELEKQKFISQLEQLSKSKEALLESLTHEEENYNKSMVELQQAEELSQSECTAHIKNVAAKTIATKLIYASTLLKAVSAQQIASFCNSDKHSECKFKRLLNSMMSYNKWALHQAFKKWISVGINFTKEKKVKGEVEKTLHEMKNTIESDNKAFSNLEQENKIVSEKEDAVKSICWLLDDKISLDKCNLLSSLKQYIRFKKTVNSSLTKLIRNKTKMLLKLGFSHLQDNSSKVLDAQKIEALNQLLTDNKFAQKSFAAFRNGVSKLKFEKKLCTLYTFNNWQHQKYKEQLLKRATILSLQMEEAKNRVTLQLFFNIMRAHGKESNRSKLDAALQQTIPQRIDEQAKQASTRDELHKTRLLRCCRIISSKIADNLHSYIYHWLYLSKRFIVAKDKLITIQAKKHERRKLLALNSWLDGVHLKKSSAVNALISEIHENQEDISLQQVKSVKTLNDNKTAAQNLKLKKTKLNLLAFRKRLLKRKLYQWAYRALSKGNQRYAAKKLMEIERKNLMLKAWKKYQLNIGKLKLLNNFTERHAAFAKTSRYRNIKRLFNGLKQYTKKFGCAKATMRHALHSIKMCTVRVYLRKWSYCLNHTDSLNLRQVIGTKKSSLNKLEEHQYSLQLVAKEDTKTNEALLFHDKVRNLKFINNALNRKKHLTTYCALLKWKLFARHATAVFKKLVKFWNKLAKNNQIISFKLWLKQSKKCKKLDEEKKLNDAANRKKIIKEECANKQSGNTVSVEDIDAQCLHQIDKTKQTQKVFDKLESLIVKRGANYIYKSLKQACFEGFRDMVSHQKILMEKALLKSESIARCHALIVIKNKYLESKRIGKKGICLRKLLATIIRQHLRSGLTEWMNYIGISSVESQLQEIGTVKQQIANTSNNSENKMEKTFNDFIHKFKANKLSKILNYMVNSLKQNKASNYRFNEISKSIKSNAKGNAVRKMLFNMSYPKILDSKLKAQSNKHSARLLIGAYRLWKRRAYCNKMLPIKVDLVLNGRIKEALIQSMQLIKASACYRKSQKSMNCNDAASNMLHVLRKIVELNQIDALSQFRKKIDHDQHLNSKLKNLLIYISGMDIRKAFNQWRKSDNISKIEFELESSGPNELKCMQLRNHFEEVSRFAKRQGYFPPEFSNLVDEQVNENNSIMTSTICRWLHYSMPNQGVSDALSRWSRYVAAKKRITRALLYLHALSPGKIMYFKRWKHMAIKQKQKLMQLSKEELLIQLVKGNKRIENSIEQHSNITTQEKRFKGMNTLLDSKYSHSKTETLRYVIKIYNSLLSSGFKKWHNQACKIIVAERQNAIKQLTEKYMTHLQRIKLLQEHNKVLALESEELRVSSLESVDLLKVF